MLKKELSIEKTQTQSFPPQQTNNKQQNEIQKNDSRSNKMVRESGHQWSQ